jgi:hypothetical protein
MELKEFIEKSIMEITSALHNSSQQMIDAKTGKGISDAFEIKVSFDIAVTVFESMGQEGSGKISIAVIAGLGGTIKSGNEKQEVSRITFEVPVKLNTIGAKQITFGP